MTASLGIVVSSIQEFNNVGTCFLRVQVLAKRKNMPSGDLGFCAPIAAYYICSDLSISAIETLLAERLSRRTIDQGEQ